VKLKLFSILLGLAIISISIPAAFADVFSVDDIRCHVLPSPVPCDVTDPSADVQFMLDTLGLAIPPGFESLSPVFSVPPFPAPPITDPPTPAPTMGTIEFTALRDTGLFQYTFGVCKKTPTDAFNPVTEKRQWAVACISQAVTNPNLILFEDDGTMESFVGGDTTTISSCAAGCDVAPGDDIFFWLIPDNDVATFVGGTPPGSDFYPSQTDDRMFRAPLFMNDQANPGQFDQLLSFIRLGDPPEGITLFTWEDLTRDDLIPPNESDEDFTDLAFKSDTAFVEECPIPSQFSSVQDCLCRKFNQVEFCPPGGEFLEIDSSALLLAGLQTSAVWILPIVLAGAGTGLGIAVFHLRKK